MQLNRSMRLMVVLLLAGCSWESHSEGRAAARQFAAEFYAWYRPAGGAERGVNEVLKERRAWLTPQLASLLEADQACASRAQAVCRLDFDPFLNSQDPCEKYEVDGDMIPYRDLREVWVLVRATCSGRPDSIPTADLVLIPSGVSWVIKDVRYPQTRDPLISILSTESPAP